MGRTSQTRVLKTLGKGIARIGLALALCIPPIGLAQDMSDPTIRRGLSGSSLGGYDANPRSDEVSARAQARQPVTTPNQPKLGTIVPPPPESTDDEARTRYRHPLIPEELENSQFCAAPICEECAAAPLLLLAQSSSPVQGDSKQLVQAMPAIQQHSAELVEAMPRVGND
jgi:hypothetical protein